jgi:hypothetical protein
LTSSLCDSGTQWASWSQRASSFPTRTSFIRQAEWH